MKLFDMIEIGKDTGNFRVVKHVIDEFAEEPKHVFKPQKETKFLWKTFWEPITYKSYDFQGIADNPFVVDSLSEAIEIIKKYENAALCSSNISEIVYEERNQTT